MRINGIKNCAKFAQAIGLALVLVACGDLNVEQPNDQDQAQDEEGIVGETHEETSGETSPAETTEPAEIKPTAKDSKPAADVSVDVDVEVKVAVAVDGAMLEAARYAPQMRPWGDVVAATPAGYRLASRSELVALVDSGELERMGAAGAELWSSTEEDDRIALFVDGDSGRSARMDKTMPLAAVYVREGGQ